MTSNENYVQAICTRFIHLNRLSMDDLRMMISDDTYGSLHAARQQSIGLDKGRLIEAVIFEEFTSEFEFDLPLELDTKCMDLPVVYGSRVKEIEE